MTEIIIVTCWPKHVAYTKSALKIIGFSGPEYVTAALCIGTCFGRSVPKINSKLKLCTEGHWLWYTYLGEPTGAAASIYTVLWSHSNYPFCHSVMSATQLLSPYTSICQYRDPEPPTREYNLKGEGFIAHSDVLLTDYNEPHMLVKGKDMVKGKGLGRRGYKVNK